MLPSSSLVSQFLTAKTISYLLKHFIGNSGKEKDTSFSQIGLQKNKKFIHSHLFSFYSISAVYMRLLRE